MERHKDRETVGPMPRTVLILDFGAQYSQLIARRVREHGVYCEIIPHDTPWSAIAQREPAALILSGGPSSTLTPDAPDMDPQIVRSGLPILGDLLRHAARGAGSSSAELVKLDHAEYGPATLLVAESESPLYAGIAPESRVWMSHGDTVTKLPPGYDVLASTAALPDRIDGQRAAPISTARSSTPKSCTRNTAGRC